ncbi:probable G-protein coupled receptor 139 [Argopecten irradians]|uniref:probable G-protein coupled receptor 139 n=1 Tax=Argopecten irradians TaxID=31199 RepID=UPI0037118311
MADRNISISTVWSNESATINNATNKDGDVFSELEFYFHGIIWPVASSLGLIGNGLSSIILIQLSKSSFYLYLAMLALSDVAALAFGLSVFLNEVTSEVPLQIICSPIEACLRTFSHLSSWITVLVTVDRYIAVCHSFKVQQYCTRKRALISTGVAFLVLIVINFPIVCLEWDDSYTSCMVPEFANDYCFKYGFYTDISVYVLIPTCLISVLNIFIIRSIYHSASRRQDMVAGNVTNVPATTNIKHATMKTVTILFTVSAFFILCFLPFLAISLFAIFKNENWDGVQKLIPIPFFMSYIGVTVNHSFNFVLYGLSGKMFRKRCIEGFSFWRCFRR